MAGRLVPFSQKSSDDFEFEEKIGCGASSEVFRVCERRTGLTFAIKKISKVCNHRPDANRAFVELRALEGIRSPFVVELSAFFFDAEAFYIQMPYAGFGDLRLQLDAVQCFPEATAKVLAAQILLGLEDIHAHGVGHCDLKPENILISDTGRAIICDFELCCGSITEKSAEGTPAYMAPETLLNTSVQWQASACDVWGFGVLLYELVVGETPFASVNRYQTYKKIIAAEFAPSEVLSPVCLELITQLLVPEISQRAGCGVEGIVELKWHAFFEGINWSALRNGNCPNLKEEFVRPLLGV